MIIYLTGRNYAIEVSVVLKIDILFDIAIERGFVKILRFVPIIKLFNLTIIFIICYISLVCQLIYYFFKAIANLCNLIYIATNLQIDIQGGW